MGLKVGITGGIGSGKTTICQTFKVLGVPVFDADQETKILMQTNPELIEGIKRLFGEQAYNEQGVLDRSYLANLVFKDESMLQKLNSLVHPVAIQAAVDWAESQDATYTLKEAALLFESGSYKHNDVNILVTAPEEVQIHRV
ncbi:MAG TPA: dephospho-CoA kinase, partial [Sphingobacteriaceae bacterium]|nr:dephospho-CoA kinase [Sphingobacteriaceae bacterium]